MKLLYQTHSPFARKALAFAHEAGLASSITVIHHETSPTLRNKKVFSLNPLGKVPVLITDSNTSIFDSHVICIYLNTLSKKTTLIPELISENPKKHIEALRLEAIADGLSEAGILARWEMTRRPEALRYEPFQNGQLEKLTESYQFIEDNITLNEEVSIGEIALATSLSWLEFRELPSFRHCAKLSQWYDNFITRDSMLATTLVGDTHD
jgi:glutathione S-transferase